MRRTPVLVSLVVLGLAYSPPMNAEPLALRVEGPSNLFADKEAVFRVFLSGPAAAQGSAAWVLQTGGRTLARGERAFEVGPARPVTVEIRFQTPAVKEGAVLDLVLGVAALEGAGRTASTNIEKRLWVFPENAFAERTEWLKKLNIVLFDPVQKTAAVFEKSKLPFKEVRNVDALGALKDATLVVGEGVSLKDYRGLADSLVKAAAAGVPVLCLAPAGGDMSVPGLGDTDLPQPSRVSFRRQDIITELDKRLATEAWPPDGHVVAGGLRLRGERGPVKGEVAAGDDGWPWVEMRFGEADTKLVMCGFGIVAKWDATPTPRYLLVRLLEYMTNRYP